MKFTSDSLKNENNNNNNNFQEQLESKSNCKTESKMVDDVMQKYQQIIGNNQSFNIKKN